MSWSLTPWVHTVLIFWVNSGDVHTDHFAAPTSIVLELQAELATIFMKHCFYLKERLPDKLQVFRLGCSGGVLSKNERSEPLTSRKTTGSINLRNINLVFANENQN